MSNISRRDFMKTAGVMTLAVAASGVLAGCSNAADTTEEVVKTASNSAKIGKFTYTIDSKLYKVTTYTEKEGEETNEVDSVSEYLVVVVTEDGEVGKTPEVINVKTTGMSDGKSAISTLGYKGIKKAVFGKELEFATAPSDGKLATTPAAATKAVTYYTFVYEVVGYMNGSFKTPSFELVYGDDDKKNYTTIAASIPAATEVKGKEAIDDILVASSNG